MTELLKSACAAAAGGFAGGALVGLAEAAVVAATSSATEYWVFLFGAVAYGCFGAGLGAAVGVAGRVWETRQRSDLAGAAGTGAGAAAAALGLVVARFRIARDVFGEALPLLSATGIAVHGGLLVAAGAVFLFLRARVRAMAAKRGPWLAGLGLDAGVVLLGVIASVVLNGLGGGQPAQRAREAAERHGSGPNVLLIIADTLRADHVGAYGMRSVRTPSIDSLAADGILFERAYADSSWTRPSIATILTSLYPSSHSVMHKTDVLPDAVVTIAEAFRKAGYATAGFVTNINVAPSFHFEQGFDTYDYLAPDFFFGATDSASKLSLYSGMRLVRERFLSKRKYVNHYYQDAKTVNGASLPWLERTRGRPFFVLIHYMDPHDPYFEIPYNGRAVARVETPNPPAEKAEELRTLYQSNVEYMDRFLGALFGRLRAAGIYDDTIIAFTADHGEEFQEHGGWWHGTTLYDEVLHVPLIIKLSGQRQAGTRVREIARLVDVMPTLLAAAGVEVPPTCQGRDLLAGGQAPEAVYAEEDHEGNVLKAIRTERWKLILANEGNPRGLPPVALFDLKRDPAEQVNLAERMPDRVAALRADLAVLEQAAAAQAVRGEHRDIDAASRERLRALGYIQ
ncbi:MAG: hypothetical protein D6815_01945 [Candidatus Dadabacteria bacterium]|nr:MAG: hypothetical protein D6815_01945 [Candidatus Dadabacteria bacterium]